MSDETGNSAQAEPGVLESVTNAVTETGKSWYGTAKAVATGDSGIVEGLKTDSHDKEAVKNIKNLGNMATTGIAAAGVVKGGMAAYATCGGLAAVGVFAGALAAGAGGAFIGAGLVNYFALDEKLLDLLGKPKLAKPGREPATIFHEIAHGSVFKGALFGLLAGVAAGVALAAVICTGGAAAVIVGALVAGAVGGGVGALVNGFFSKSATVTGKIIQGSPNVFFEGQPVARVTDQVECKKHSPSKVIAEGSQTIFINNLPLARIGHKTTCTATIQQGCKTIFADNTTYQYLEMDSELSAREQAVVSTAEVVLAFGVGRLLSKLGLRCGEPINPADGSFYSCRTDFEYPSILPLKLTRTYSGKDPAASILGSRWICNWSQRLVYLSDEPTANLEDGEGEVLQYPLGKGREFNSRNLKAAHYHLRGTKERATLFDTRSQQSLVFETTRTNPDIGRLTSIQDRNNNRIDFIYEGDHLRRVEHSDGATFYITTTSQGFIETITSGESSMLQPLVQYAYTASGELADVQGLFTGEFHYTYTKEGWLNHWRDSGPTSVEIEYDAEGRVIAVRTPEGMYNDRFVYYPEEKKTEYQDAEGGCFSYWFNENNQVIREQDPLGNVTTHEVSGLDRRLSTTDALGRKTTFDYDTFGNLIGETDWTGRSTSYSHDKYGQLTGADYPDGTSSSWKYDNNGNLVSATGPDGLTTHFSYDAKGRLLYEIAPDSSYSRLEYTPQGRLAAVLDPLGNRTSFHLDGWKRPLEVTDSAGHSTSYDYDLSPDNPRAELSRILHPDGGEERFSYDREGLPATIVGAEGQTTHYRHGAFDLLRKVIDPKGHTTELHYDNAARLKQITNAQRQQWTYHYDLAGKLAAETDWAGRKTVYVRDAIGRVITKRLPDGIEQRLSWDEQDRVTAVETAQQRITYEYDNSDRLIRAATFGKESMEPESDLLFFYDDKGRLLKEIQNGATIEYRYDLMGRCISRETSAGETSFTYDHAGQFKGLSSNGHGLDFTRDSRGLEIHRGYRSDESSPSEVPDSQSLNAFSLKQSYDPCGRLNSQLAGQTRQISTHEKLSELSRKYSWDKSGRLIGVKDSKRGTSRFSYDPRDQIEHITRITGLNKQTEEKYDYDALMNLARSNGRNHQYEGGTVRTIGRSSYRYDLRGRTIEKKVHQNGFRPKTWRYSWDDFDRLAETHTPDGAVWKYTYDAFGRRVKKECIKAGEFGRTQSITYLWHGATIAEELKTFSDGNNQPTQISRWHFEPGTFNPIAKETLNPGAGAEKAGEPAFYPIVTDHLGTPKELFDTDGRCLWQAEHSLWGRTEVSAKKADNYLPVVVCNLRFQNQWEDEESGLYYNLNRYYDPDSGQYLSTDPIGLYGGLRTHGYVHDPMQWVDPWGLINLNNNSANGNFGVYEISVNNQLHKIGKADLNRVTQSSGLPTRLHQQDRKLSEIYGRKNVESRVVENGYKTTEAAKTAETARLQAHYDRTKAVPQGNEKSFKPKC